MQELEVSGHFGLLLVGELTGIARLVRSLTLTICFNTAEKTHTLEYNTYVSKAHLRPGISDSPASPDNKGNGPFHIV